MIGLQPLTLKEASLFINRHHRHHKAPRGGLFAIGAHDGTRVVGVAVVGRPTARHYQDGWTAEVVRLATDSTPHVSSMLYAACWRACRAMGYRRLGTYTLASEAGTSLKAARWVALYETRIERKGWHRPSRPRVNEEGEAKRFWAPDAVWETYPAGTSITIGD